MRELYANALDALLGALPGKRIAVVSDGDHVLEIARYRGTVPIRQIGSGLNDAVQDGVAYAARAGAEAVLVVLADLPFLSTEAMEALLACSHGGREVVIAPGQRGGTHALLVRPPAWLQFSFGPDSLRTHLKQVVKARARLALYEELALTFDIDLPEDLRKVATLDPDLLRCVAARRDDKEDRYEN